MCCSVLQRVAVCRVGMCMVSREIQLNMLWCVIMCCSVLQCCNKLQCVTVSACCKVYRIARWAISSSAYCNLLQHVAICRSVLQFVAVYACCSSYSLLARVFQVLSRARVLSLSKILSLSRQCASHTKPPMVPCTVLEMHPKTYLTVYYNVKHHHLPRLSLSLYIHVCIYIYISIYICIHISRAVLEIQHKTYSIVCKCLCLG